MAIVAGVDFGTLSVRVTIVDSARGRLGSGVAEYPLHRKKEDPNFATQSHADHMRALGEAVSRALADAGVSGNDVAAIALDTTGSSVIPVGKNLEPLGEYYLWCDHRASGEAALITETARAQHLEAIDWCGGIYSSEWGFSKLLHWLRHNPDRRSEFASAFEHCDMVAAVLCGVTDPAQAARSICAMGHKWMWNASLGGLPSEEFLRSVDPLLSGVRAKLAGRYATSDRIAGVGQAPWSSRRHSDSRGRLRCALGRHRRRRRHRRRGQRRRHIHLHHRHERRCASGARRMRRRARLGAPEKNRRRSRPLRHRRHLRGHRPPRGRSACRALEKS
jgi:L-ribulokinase